MRLLRSVAVFDGAGGLPPSDIEFSALKRAGGESMIQTLKFTNYYVDPLSYPILFPYGEKVWNPDIRYAGQVN